MVNTDSKDQWPGVVSLQLPSDLRLSISALKKYFITSFTFNSISFLSTDFVQGTMLEGNTKMSEINRIFLEFTLVRDREPWLGDVIN